MINGIQQVGIGTRDVHTSWKWYRQHFGFDTPVFNEEAEAPLMTRYTGGESQSRHAILAMNLNGGGGMEIWQFKSRTPVSPSGFSLNQTGILVTRLKCQTADTARKAMNGHRGVNPMVQDPVGKPAFSVTDPFGNAFIVAESDNFFRKKHTVYGGIEGVVIGVSDMQRSLDFYRNVLEMDNIVYDRTGVFEDFKHLEGGDQTFHRVRITPSKRHRGAFSEVFGDFYIELIEVKSQSAGDHRFEDRFWGDPGFIHLCFDVNEMGRIKTRAEKMGSPFTIDSGETFSMGEAAGRFAYLEDPDGTLIELVETDKITVSKKLGWYLTLSDSRKKKPLPRWIFSVVALNRVKD